MNDLDKNDIILFLTEEIQRCLHPGAIGLIKHNHGDDKAERCAQLVIDAKILTAHFKKEKATKELSRKP